VSGGQSKLDGPVIVIDCPDKELENMANNKNKNTLFIMILFKFKK